MTRIEPLPERIRTWAALAEEAGLSEPLGRAITAHARIVNAGWRVTGGPSSWAMTNRMREASGHDILVPFMGRMHEATARRWREHWERGGSLRTLSRSAEQQQDFAFKRSIALLDEGERLRRVIKRVRRKLRTGALDIGAEP